jgi:hypothetical protein
MDDFQNIGILYGDHPGVVIGLGDGWYKMKKTDSEHTLISPSSPHLDFLRATPGGPIGHIIRGGHRTAAMKQLSKKLKRPYQNFWYYNVLVPGINIFSFLILMQLTYCSAFFLATNTLPPALLLDFSFIDNIQSNVLQNTYHHICMNYSQIAAYNYSIHDGTGDLNQRIQYVVRELHKKPSPLNISNFRNLLRFKEVAPHLARLLYARGIWTMNCELAFCQLVNCRVEQVCNYCF